MTDYQCVNTLELQICVKFFFRRCDICFSFMLLLSSNSSSGHIHGKLINTKANSVVLLLLPKASEEAKQQNES